MNLQKTIIDKLTKYATEKGKECEFIEIPDSDGVMKYVEEVHDEDTDLDYTSRICIFPDGSLMIYSYMKLDLEKVNIDKANEYLAKMTEVSESFDYEIEGETLFVTAYISENGLEDLGEDFECISFGATKPEFVDCMVGLIAYLEGDETLEDAVEIGLGNCNEDEEEFDPGQFMYFFQHRVLTNNFLENPTLFIENCLRKPDGETKNEEENDLDFPKGVWDNYVFALFHILTLREGIEQDFEVSDFEITHSKLGSKYELIRINMPEPIKKNLCYKMNIVYEEGKENEARLFTLEAGENNTQFLCSWVIRNDNLTHLNYDVAPKNISAYKAKLEKIYEGKISEMVAYTPE